MDGLPSDVDLAFLVDRELEGLLIYRQHGRLVFDEGVSIELYDDIGHRSKIGELDAIYKTVIAAAPTLLTFLNSIITDVSVAAQSTLVLRFSNDETLELYVTTTEYESYVIHRQDQCFVA